MAAMSELPVPKVWDAAKQVLECVGVREEAPSVRTFVFRAGPETWFRYRPGQFITLQLPVTGGHVARTYTISSSPSRPFSISVTAKMQEGSIGTRWMFENLGPGSRIEAQGPMGHFVLPDPPARPLLLISAGSGATPVMSMLRWCADCAPDTDIAWVHCARRPEDILFRTELEALTKGMPRLRLSFVVSNGADAAFHSGRLDAMLLRGLVPDLLERDVKCCGPDGFMAGMRAGLVELGHDPAQYDQESFGAVAEVVTPSSGGAGFPIRFTVSMVEAVGEEGQTILEVARAAGIAIPSACGMGICGTCKVKGSGEVNMTDQGGIFDDEIADGMLLACCSRPLGPVEIEA